MIHASGAAKNEADGDQVQLHLEISGNRIRRARMKVMGCVAAIASTSLLTVLIEGRSVEDAMGLTKESLTGALGGLPENKVRCSLTCIDALRHALTDYRKKRPLPDEEEG